MSNPTNSEPTNTTPKTAENQTLTTSEKLKHISRSPQKQLNDVLSQSQIILTTPDENLSDDPDTIESVIKQWRKDSTPLNEQDLHTYFDGNYSVLGNYERTVVDPTATTAEIDSQFNRTLRADKIKASRDAMAILAVQKFIQQKNFEASLFILNTQEDLVFLPQIVEPINNWIDTQSKENPNFLTDFIPELTKNKKFNGRNLLQIFRKPEPYEFIDGEQRQTPQGIESLIELSNIGREINNYREQKSNGNGLRLYERNYRLENQIDKNIGDITYSLEKSQKNGLSEALNQTFQSPVESLRSLKKLSDLCQSEWYRNLSSTNSNIQDRIRDMLIAATIVELQSTENEINNKNIAETHRVKSLEIIGTAIATIKHSGVQEQISNALDLSVRQFVENRPGIANELTRPIDNTNQQIENQIKMREEAAQKEKERQNQIETENQERLTAAAHAETNKKMINLAYTFRQLSPQNLLEISQGKSTDYNSSEAIEIAKKIFEQIQKQTQVALEQHQTKKGSVFGIGGTMVIDDQYIKQLQEQESSLNLQLNQNPSQNDDESLNNYIKLASLHHVISWTRNYKSNS